MLKNVSRYASFILCAIMIFSFTLIPFCSSNAVTVNDGILGLDLNPSGGYEGDYVLIYNPSTSASSALTTGSLSGKTVTSSVSEKQAVSDGMMPVHFEAPDVVFPASKPLYNQLITNDIYSTGQQRVFNVFPTIGSNTLVSKTFTLACSGKSCYVWYVPSEENAITQQQAQSIADEYDNKIKPIMLENFGDFYDPTGMGRLNVLVYDIQDGFGSTTNSYHTGFFWSGDLVNTYGNMAAMIHLDTYPTITYNGTSSLDSAFNTIAHEMQHLISFSKYWTNTQSGSSAWASTWLDEACSMAAQEAVYPDSVLQNRIEQLNNYGTSYAGGYSAYGWNESDIACYGMNCLFGQYIKTQAGSYKAFKSLLDVFGNEAQPTDEKAVMAALYGSALDSMSLSDIMLAFRIALIANDPDDNDGIYGFLGSTKFNDVSPLLYTSSNAATIYGGGAIVIKPKNGVYTPASNASAGLVYVGITLKDHEAACILDEEEKTIYNIEPNMSPSKVEDFILASFPNITSATVIGMRGNYVGTGCIAYLYENGSSTPSVYTVKIFGDLNGSGTIDVADATTIMNHIVGINELHSMYADIADVNHDGYITVADATTVMSHVVGIEFINQK